jgi:hypothetical protein
VDYSVDLHAIDWRNESNHGIYVHRGHLVIICSELVGEPCPICKIQELQARRRVEQSAPRNNNSRRAK